MIWLIFHQKSGFHEQLWVICIFRLDFCRYWCLFWLVNHVELQSNFCGSEGPSPPMEKHGVFAFSLYKVWQWLPGKGHCMRNACSYLSFLLDLAVYWFPHLNWVSIVKLLPSVWIPWYYCMLKIYQKKGGGIGYFWSNMYASLYYILLGKVLLDKGNSHCLFSSIELLIIRKW